MEIEVKAVADELGSLMDDARIIGPNRRSDPYNVEPGIAVLLERALDSQGCIIVTKPNGKAVSA